MESIDNFTAYLHESNIRNVKVVDKGSRIVIASSIVNVGLFRQLLLFFFFIAFFFQDMGNEFYYYRVLFFNTIILIWLWLEFNLVNSLIIDLDKKKIFIRSKNIFKRLICNFLMRERQGYDFDKIAAIGMKFDNAYRLNLVSYTIFLRLKHGITKPIIVFRKESLSLQYVNFVNELLHAHR